MSAADGERLERSPLLNDEQGNGNPNNRSRAGQQPRPAAASDDMYPGRASSFGSSSGNISDSISDDEAFARRLQEEESQAYRSYQSAEAGRYGRPVAAAAGNNNNRPRRPSLRDREQVRNAMLADVMAQSRYSAFNLILMLFVYVPQLSFIIYYSIKYNTSYTSCDAPLNFWLVLYGGRMVVSLFIASLPVAYPEYWLRRNWRLLNDSWDLIGLFVFILGCIWTFNSHTCKHLNPEIYKLCFWLVMIQAFIMILPCLLLICLAPAVFCCLPLLIRLTAFLPPSMRAGMGPVGADQSLIDKLPPPVKFARGMFGSSAKTPPPPNASGSPQTNHDEPECAICLSNYSVGESVRQLPCQGRHHFHQACCDSWLKVNASCPCCREALLPVMNDPSLANRAPSNRSAEPDSRRGPVVPSSPAQYRGEELSRSSGPHGGYFQSNSASPRRHSNGENDDAVDQVNIDIRQ